jgi:homopolymeric O-antigen transport system permease protein
MLSAQTARRAIWQPLWELPRRYELVLSLARRDLVSRYKGSVLGIVWAVLNPVVMIAIFTFIFANVFGARFGPSTSAWDYALYLFCGLLPWTMFQETVQRATTTIITHANLVKRVLFPLETLPAAQTLSSLANQLFGTIALLLATLILRKHLPLTIFFLPLLLVPQTLLTIGAAWLVSSLGVFIRDLTQGISLLLMAWMYLTPIIYPESVVPDRYRGLLNINPFTALVRSYRRIVLEGLSPDWMGMAYFSVFSLIAFCVGYWWFARTRKNFADVI